MNVAVLPFFPTDAGLTRALYAQIIANTVTEPDDSFGMLAMLYAHGADDSHGGPCDLTVWNTWFGAEKYAPGTARYAAYALGFAGGCARWSAGLG